MVRRVRERVRPWGSWVSGSEEFEEVEMIEALWGSFKALVEQGEIYLILLPIYTILLVGERIAHRWMSERPWNEADGAANVAITIGYLGLNVLVGHIVPLGAMAWIFNHASLWSLEIGPVGWLVAFLLYDLAWYVDHRVAHRTGLFWAMHHVHHSSSEYNMTVASRGFLLDNTLLTRPLFYLLPVLGVSPFQFMVIITLTNILGIAQHTGLVGRLGPLDWLLATPSNHRVHHGSNDKYLDRNYGEVLMIWDHLFGTWQREEETPTYGVTEPIDTCNPLRIEVAGLQWLARKMGRASGPWDRLRCLFMPPGWEPDAAARAPRSPSPAPEGR